MTFDERIQKAIAETRSECHYRPTAFIQMVNSYGAFESVKRLLTSRQNIPSGLEKLWELGRLDLCFERIIFEPEWHDMFSKDELSEAKKDFIPPILPSLKFTPFQGSSPDAFE